MHIYDIRIVDLSSCPQEYLNACRHRFLLKRFNQIMAMANVKEIEIGRENRPVIRAEKRGDIEAK